LIPLEQNCCGIAGTYGFKKENYETSMAIGEKLFEQIRKANPDIVATDCETCRWQIEMGTDYPVLHPVSLFAQALEDED
jgi:glycerol-3-phosphate dehydrogenase subunit C